MANVTGEITAETTNGDIWIDNAQSQNLEASTVNGDVTFNGTIRDSGTYRLTTHGGDIRVGLGGAANASVFVRTFQGDFGADFPIQLPEGQSMRSGSKRFNFTLGNGSARIELQSFNGDIVLACKAIVSKEEERQRRRRGIQAPPAPPAPPAPGAPPAPAPAPKPPKPPGFAWNFDHNFDFNFQDLNVDVDVDVDFDFDFDVKFDKDFEEKIGKQIEKSLKSIARKY